MPSKPRVFRARPSKLKSEMDRQFDLQRGSARERGYSTAWDKASAAYRRSHPLCVGCDAVGRVKATEVVDHIQPHHGDQTRFWDQANWQPLCTWHHSVVKQSLEFSYQQGRLPLSALRCDSPQAIALTRDLDP